MPIRDAIPDDAPAVAKVYLDSVLAAYAEIATADSLSTRTLPKCTDQWTYNIHDDAIEVVVAECDGEIEGVASFGRARDEDVDVSVTGEIQAIYVSPDCWTRGIGRQLCDHVLHQLYSDGFTSVLLWVLSDNGIATRFYERVGFTPDGASKTVTMGNELLAIRYRLSQQALNKIVSA